MIVNLISDSTAEIRITDLHGFTIESFTTRDVTDFFPFHRIEQSSDLKTLVTNGDIIINDGIQNLSVANGLTHLNHLTEYESKHDLVSDLHSGIPTPGSGNKVLESQDSTAFIWIDTPSTGESEPAFIFCFFEDSKDYKEVGNDYYQTIGNVIFPGSSISEISSIKIITSRSGSSNSSFMRLYDFTNFNEIVEIEWTAVNKAIYTGSLTNLPSEEAIFEVQMKKAGGDNSRIHYLAIY